MNWSKKKCVEYIRQMKSPIEETNKGNGVGGGFPQIIQRLKEWGGKGKNGSRD